MRGKRIRVPGVDGPKPWTNKLNHGSGSEKTALKVIQHVYWGGEEGFLEVVEIKDPPVGNSGIAIVQYHSRYDQYVVVEWRDLRLAKWVGNEYASTFRHEFFKLPGYVKADQLDPGKTPWFYLQSCKKKRAKK